MRTVAMLANEAADAVQPGRVRRRRRRHRHAARPSTTRAGRWPGREAIGLARVVHRAGQSRRRLRRGPLPRLAAAAPPAVRRRAAAMTEPTSLARALAAAMFERDGASQGLGMVIEEVRAGLCAAAHARAARHAQRPRRPATAASSSRSPTSAFAFACNSRNRATVAAGAAIEFLAPVRAGDVLVAEARGAGARRPARRLRRHRPSADGRAVALFRGRSYALQGDGDPGRGGPA